MALGRFASALLVVAFIAAFIALATREHQNGPTSVSGQPSTTSSTPTIGPTRVLPPIDVTSVGARSSSNPTVELIVDTGHPSASVMGPGTEESPFSAIQPAIDASQDLRGAGVGVAIVIRPGVYREQLSIGRVEGDAPLLIDGGGRASVRGSDVWGGWTAIGDGLWVHAWPYDWGSAPGLMGPVGRREIVFVDGARLRPVTSQGELGPGAFHVDEAEDLVRIEESPELDIADSFVEVAVRPHTLHLDGASNVTIRGIEFTHAASPFDSTGVVILNSSDISLLDLRISDNSWTGLGIATSNHLTLERNVVTNNGGGGVGIFSSPFVLMSENETSLNNWRGSMGDYLGWSIAGVKMVGQKHVLIRDHRSVDNETRGFWLDYDISDVVIEGAIFCRNRTDGIMIEASLGPIQMLSMESCDNGQNGVLIVNSIDVGIAASLVCGNGAAAVRLDSEPGGRILETESGPVDLPAAENLTLVGNRFGDSPNLVFANLSGGEWGATVETLVSDGNLWSAPDPTTAFVFPGGSGPLELWRRLTSMDAGSTFEAGPGC